MPEYSVAQLLEHVNSSYSKPGNERVRQIAERLIADIYRIMVDFNVSHAELWSFFTWLNDLGTAKQAGLLGAGIGLERLLDILADEADQHAQRAPGTPRAIEGPLYIPHAPLSTHEARLDDGSETGEPLVMEGTVRNTQGHAVPQAIVDVWHAGQGGGYSFFDPSRRSITGGGSKRMSTATTCSAACFLPAMECRPTARPNSCSMYWAGMAPDRHTSIL
jgi:catechol 1,2-dioxygenase